MRQRQYTVGQAPPSVECTICGTLRSCPKNRLNESQRSSFERRVDVSRCGTGSRRVFSAEDRKRVGHDVMTVEYGWPVGMPTCGHLEDGIYEVRTNLPQNRIARVLFSIDKLGRMVLLH